MVNVLVVDDNLNYSKNLINIITNQNPKVRLCNICTDGEEVINMITSHQSSIDIILLDLKLPNYNGIEILYYIQKNNLTKYQDSIIAISGEMGLLSKLKGNSYLHSFISKVAGFEKITREINDLIEMKESEKYSIEYKVHKELEKLNFNFSYVGTQYLYETILILYNKYNDCFEDKKLEKNIYPIISKKYKKSVNNIKTNIINASNAMYYDCEYKILKEYFGVDYNEKPKPKEIVIKILNNIKYEKIMK